MSKIRSIKNEKVRTQNNGKNHGQRELPHAKKRPRLVKQKSKGAPHKFEPDPARHHTARNFSALIPCKIELARNFYWCDELDFHIMRPPVRDLLAFVNHEFGDVTLSDVLHFLPRIQASQRAARSYIRYRFLFKPLREMEWAP